MEITYIAKFWKLCLYIIKIKLTQTSDNRRLFENGNLPFYTRKFFDIKRIYIPLIKDVDIFFRNLRIILV